MRHLLLTLTALSLSYADARQWKNTDGSQTFEGEFVSRDASQVTLKRTDNKNHPNGGETAVKPGTPEPAFDTLFFGDSRTSVETKLKASRFVELTVEEAHLGRFGLNGVFKTRKQIGGKSYFLYFDWNGDSLKEITLQTENLSNDDYAGVMKESWKELASVLSTLYGKPTIEGAYPSQSAVGDGSFTPSHSWKLTPGVALLGVARDGKTYQVVVRFKKDPVGIVEIP
ncbi:MAG: hypothetical protein CFE26_07860 [Verrucomicrobiales bacterium VVV1]|nr:MAG: hypothetical protein CFE26_07860 [Verrucomicrobiales bacterium VVV1]